MTLQAAIDAMRYDAGVWDDVSQVLGRAGQEAQVLVLGEPQLSWASRVTGLETTYAEIQDKVAMLLGEGTRETAALSKTLDEVATAYQLDDENAAARMQGVWEVRD